MRACRLFLLLALSLPCAFAEEARSPLADHPSPYLALHADDPVHWRLWHPDLLDIARRKGRLLFISSGYFACHWCHVMQRESFQNADIAALLNRMTLPIKVDRELQPVLDAALIEFVRATRGHAGWPLNVFLTPDGDPLQGLVYASPAEFLHLLQNLEASWSDEREELSRLAREAARELRTDYASAPTAMPRGRDLLEAYDRAMWAQADDFEGGFGQQAKFPHVPRLRWLLEQEAMQPDARRAAFLELTLEQMARGGLRDHIGGGFFRYTVDPGWREPHFEKMLHDNAQLMGLYARAAVVLEDSRWRDVAEDTYVFLQRDMRGTNGAYHSSLSALDGQGVEGGYYLWADADLDRLLDAGQRRLAARAFGMQGVPPFGIGHLPVRVVDSDSLAEDFGLAPRVMEARLAELAAILHAARQARVLPVDDKQLASWNGLMLQGLVELARLTGDENHLEAARAVREAVVSIHVDGRRVYRMRGSDGYALPGELEDYAQLVAGLLAWADLSGSEADRRLVRQLVTEAWARFHGPQGWRVSEAALPLVSPWRLATGDDAMPSAIATLLVASARLAREEGDQALARRVDSARQQAAPVIAADPLGHSSYFPLLIGDGVRAQSR